MKTSKKGIELIKSFEGFRANAYKCSSGVVTIGYGHTSGVKMGDVITEKQGEEYLKQDLETSEKAVSKYVKVSLSQNMFDALVSFTFNCGSGALKNSTLLKKLNKGNYVVASEEFARWNKAGTKVVSGLVKRRAKEKALFLEGYSKEEESTFEIPSLKGYKGFSIVDGLKSFGYEYSFEYRKKVATAIGINSYKGTSKQNTALLNYLKSH